MPSIPSAKTLRRSAQYMSLAACLYTGWLFARFLHWVSAGGPPVPRPAGVEAFLPIAALAGLKNFLFTGAYDPVHPAGLTVLLAAIATSFFFRKSFCGAVCPVGLVSELLGAAGKRLGMERRAPRLLGWTLGVLKYEMLAFFVVSIFLFMDTAGTRQFLTSSYNLAADAHLFRLFAHPSARFLAILAGLAVLGAVFRGAWCRWLCPYGALLGLCGLAGPSGVRHHQDSCDGCGKCRRACPMDIAPGRAANSPECLGCGQCVEACPNPGALHMTVFGIRVPAWTVAACGVALFAAVCLLAAMLGYWDNGLPPRMLKSLYAPAIT